MAWRVFHNRGKKKNNWDKNENWEKKLKRSRYSSCIKVRITMAFWKCEIRWLYNFLIHRTSLHYQGTLECCSSWDCKESDTTEQLNNNTTFPANMVPGSEFPLTLCPQDPGCPITWADPKRNCSREFRKMTVPSALWGHMGSGWDERFEKVITELQMHLEPSQNITFLKCLVTF